MPGQFDLACGKKIYTTDDQGRRKLAGYCNLPKRHAGKCSM
jgi:hypothetical protein